MSESVQYMNSLGSFGYIAMPSIVSLSITSFDADHANRTPFQCEHVYAHHLLLDLFSGRQLDSTIEEDQSRMALACHSHQHQTNLFCIHLG